MWDRFANRIRAVFRAPRAIGRAEVALDGPAKRDGASFELVVLVERRGRRGQPEQRECLVIEKHALVEDRSVDRDQGAKQSVAALIVSGEVLHPTADDPAASPRQPNGLRCPNA